MQCPVCVGLKTKLSRKQEAKGKEIYISGELWWENPCPACGGTGEIPDVLKGAKVCGK